MSINDCQNRMPISFFSYASQEKFIANQSDPFSAANALLNSNPEATTLHISNDVPRIGPLSRIYRRSASSENGTGVAVTLVARTKPLSTKKIATPSSGFQKNVSGVLDIQMLAEK